MVIRVVAVIPARMASRRLPGKPLLEINGLPMIEHVRRRVLLCKLFAEVVVATCDQEIASVVRAGGGRCLMTSPNHPGATDRVAEAAGLLECTHVVNVQGDEILVMPDDLRRMVKAIEAEPDVPAWNAVARIAHAEELADRAIVKSVVSRSGRILFCARDISTLRVSAESGFEPVRWILGILAFRRDALERYVRLSRTPIEQAEALDQSRLIEHDVVLRAVEFAKPYPGINEPREADRVRHILAEDRAQQAILQKVLSVQSMPDNFRSAKVISTEIPQDGDVEEQGTTPNTSRCPVTSEGCPGLSPRNRSAISGGEAKRRGWGNGRRSSYQ